MISNLVGFKSINLKQFYALLILALFLTDLVIISNISFLRSFLPFLFFTIVPGFLILQIFKLNEIKFLKKVVLWVGLSISVLIFVGLFLNSLYPLLLHPLSLIPLLFTLNLFIIVMILIAYQRNKDKLEINSFNFNLENKLVFPLILPLLFPFMAILGTYFMNNYESNILLLLMLILVPIYLVFVIYLKDRVSNAIYPISLWMISMSLLLMNGLSSNHLMGRDIHTEFYCFQLTLDGYHWDISKFYDTFNACLSITILPTIYEVLSNINDEYIFKIFFPLIGSIVPLIVYITSSKYLDDKYAFLASFSLICLAFFASESMAVVRQMVSLLFFFLAIFVLFDVEISKKYKKVLFLILIISVVFSHYSTAYLSFIFTLPILALPFLKSIYESIKSSKLLLKFTNFDIIIIYLISLFIWYNLVAYIQVNKVSNVVNTISSLSGSGSGTILAEKTTDNMILAMLGIGLKSLPNTLSAFAHDAFFIIIGIGFLALIWKYNYFKEKIESEFYLGILISISLLAAFIVVPYISLYYGTERVLFQALIFLAPVSVIGAKTLAKVFKKPNLDVVILLILLISLFSCNTYLQYHFLGEHHSPFYEKDGVVRDEYYIHEQELVAAKWLNGCGVKDLKIYSDAIAGSRLSLAPNKPNLDSFAIRNIIFKNGYTYLGYVNVKMGFIYPQIMYRDTLENYEYIFKNKSKIYDNGGGAVYFD